MSAAPADRGNGGSRTADRPETDGSAHPRIAALVARFREIGATRMADLPIYNQDLEVEAVGFRPFGEGWIGVLITPWFINVMVLPAETQPMDDRALGRLSDLALPSGARPFMTGGDEVIGAYQALSLHSPVMEVDQDGARTEAERRLALLLTPTGEGARDGGAETPSTASRKTAPRVTTVYRRDFPRGGRRA